VPRNECTILPGKRKVQGCKDSTWTTLDNFREHLPSTPFGEWATTLGGTFRLVVPPDVL
jgi:hypothetical protein